MGQRGILLMASVFGFAAVGLGAFGAHAFKGILSANGRTDTFDLAVRYHFYHTLAILAVGILAEKFPLLRNSAYSFALGILIFSGSLYSLSLTNKTWWGAVTPFGGLAFLAGWASFFWTIFKRG